MKKISLDPKNIDHSLIKEAAKVLTSGGVVALPTETVYGLAGRPDKQATVDKLYSIKKRPKDKPFSIAVDDPEKAIRFYLATLPPFGYRLLEEFWPGPLTVVFYDRNDKAIGVRVPDSPIIREVLKEANTPVCLPSANVSGEGEILSADGVEETFGNEVDLIVDGGPCEHGRASTVLDLTFYPFKILRHGVASEKRIIEVFTRKRILFVCTGNTCRSPMAQFLMQIYLAQMSPYAQSRYEVISRGISAFGGLMAASNVIEVIKEKEKVDVLNFVSQKLDRYTLLSSDLIFTMEDDQLNYVLKFEPTVEGRIFNLKKFLPAEFENDISDPVGKGKEVYEQLYETLSQAIKELMNWL
ncbi:MAG: threonylcarbamoyl-AMP synthase [Candidatus Omnitrophica bacterium]|nr:threonylcarbamoyl-AMP synthase [Candidatus Omnitrophota bacterium]